MIVAERDLPIALLSSSQVISIVLKNVTKHKMKDHVGESKY